MLFAGDDGVKKVRVLSGGEKVRCQLSKMMIQATNTLIFDEPTNHLDMESITALNNALIKYPGVILFSCHDHQFVQTTANRIMEITPNGLIDKITTYDEYLETTRWRESARKATPSRKATPWTINFSTTQSGGGSLRSAALFCYLKNLPAAASSEAPGGALRPPTRPAAPEIPA